MTSDDAAAYVRGYLAGRAAAQRLRERGETLSDETRRALSEVRTEIRATLAAAGEER